MQSFAKDKQIIIEGYLHQFKNPDDPILCTRRELVEFINEFFKEMSIEIDWETLSLKKIKKHDY